MVAGTRRCHLHSRTSELPRPSTVPIAIPWGRTRRSAIVNVGLGACEQTIGRLETMSHDRGSELDRQHFVDRYARLRSPQARRVERAVFGLEAGLTGYTTARQADALAGELELMSRHRLLDVGAGQGWPGIRLAAASGCRLVSSDLPLNALAQATRAFERQGLARTSNAVAAAGLALPFASGAFDAIVHADVFC